WRKARGIDHHARVRQFGQPLQLVGLVPDDVEKANDLLNHHPVGWAAVPMLKSREIGGRHAQRGGHFLLANAAGPADLTDLGGKRGYFGSLLRSRTYMAP